MTPVKERAKKVDLIVLPSDVQGTNCGNCEYYDSDKSYCNNEDVNQPVKPNWCCAKWDHKGTERVWKMEKLSFHQKVEQMIREKADKGEY